MKVFPINQTNQLQQNFKGLWGKPETSAYAGDVVSNTIIVKHYFPFKDEPKEQVDRIVRENSSHFESDWAETGGISTYSDTSVRVHTLPFTESEYDAYMSQKLIQETRKEPYKSIENYLKENGLKKYLNKNKFSKWKMNGILGKAIYPKNPVKRLIYQLSHTIKH